MRSRAADRRQQEKQIVSLMISIYCRKGTEAGEDYVPSVLPWKNMQLKEASDVLLWKRRHFVQTAKYTVIHRK